MGGSSTKTTTRTPYNAEMTNEGLVQLQNSNDQSQKTLAKWAPSMDAAIQQITNNIATPPQYVSDARTQLDKTINGDYINSNPYTGGIADLIAKKTQGNYNATFGAAGRSHGGLASLLSSQGVGDALQSFYSDNYNTERGMQQQAIGMAPTFHADEYTDANALFPAINNATVLPLNTANLYAGGITNAQAPYTTDKETTKQSMGLGQIIGLVGQVAGAAMTGGASLVPSLAGAAAGAASKSALKFMG